MRRSIILVTMVVSLSCPMEWAVKAGAHKSSLDQEWQKVEARQEIQQKKWRAIEREAERILKDMRSNEGVPQTKLRGKRH